MRRWVKRGLELALVRSGAGALGRFLRGDEILVLAYHNVVPSSHGPTGDRSLHLSFDDFRAHLDVLQKVCAVVPLQDLLDGTGTDRRRRVALTFDDAYRGALSLALPEMASRGLSATVFVCPGLLGSDGFWWDRLSDPDRGLEPKVRKEALGTLWGSQARILAWAEKEGILGDPPPDLYRPGTVGEVHAAASIAGITLGSHTWSHVNLASAPDAEAKEELKRSATWVAERPQGLSNLLTYPYGLSSPGVAASASAMGYDWAFLVHGGLMGVERPSRDPMSIPRMNIPRGVSAEGFSARVSGVWPR